MFSRRTIQELTEQIERLTAENKALSEYNEAYKAGIASREKRNEMQTAEIEALKSEIETLKDRINAALYCIKSRDEYATYLKMLLDEAAPGLLEARIEAARPTQRQWQPRRRKPRR